MSKYIINHDDPIRALSYSQISTFLRCRKQWEYSYRQNIVPSRDHTSLTIGRLVHAGMAGSITYCNFKEAQNDRRTNP